jgi:hypothetical protein
MLTTITVNGSEGLRFLSMLGTRLRGRIPPVLAAMVDHAQVARPSEHVALEVESWLAEQVARFVDELVDSGFDEVELPLLFSPQVGDEVRIVRDALVEIHVGRHELRTWRCIPRDTRGRVVARRGDVGKVLLLDAARDTGVERDRHVYISDRCMTRWRF